MEEAKFQYGKHIHENPKIQKMHAFFLNGTIKDPFRSFGPHPHKSIASNGRVYQVIRIPLQSGSKNIGENGEAFIE